MANRKIQKVLIANRGEIAVRVARGLAEMGIKSVAVYSEADRAALHVRVADEAYLIGPAPSAESYLVVDTLIEVAKKTGADAIHPGYGFLSENSSFARRVTAEGLIWIGPPPAAIDSMGHKTVAREVMQKAGVPVVPGTDALESAEEALKFAKSIGFPVLVKAAAGGGGKGMRRVDSADEFIAAYQGAQREALAAFSDDTVYVEKFVLQPKHVEFQLLSDTHGNHLHVYERDCSAQRRHQKVIEETPCPILRDDVRKAMGEVATKAAAAVDYVGAGTVEFLLDADQNFYFLEMNTRLQVEHPITELVTGIDLVHWQVRIAEGQALPFTQEDIQPRGCAIECRVYAEDPEFKFMPSPGKIHHLQVPHGPGIRDDSGVYSGAEVSMFYDPMISKLVVWASDRTSAIRRMKRALNDYIVRGIKTNIAFHHVLLDHPAFREGTYDTQFLARELDGLLAKLKERNAEAEEIATIAAVIAAFEAESQAQPSAAGAASQAGNAWKMQGRFEQLRR